MTEQASYSDIYQGVTVQPPMLSLVYGALSNQSHYMKKHPGSKTLIATPPDPVVIGSLDYARTNAHAMEAVHLDALHTLHAVEGMMRNAGGPIVSHDASASRLPIDDITDEIGALKIRHLHVIACDIRDACYQSTEAAVPVELSESFQAYRRLSRP